MDTVRKEKRLLVKKTVKRDRQHVSVLMAITADGVLDWVAYPGSIDATRFCNFVSTLPKSTVHSHLLMDNVAFHKTKSVKNMLSSINLEPLFIPAYTPDFNPIENIFSALKNIYRSLPHHVRIGSRVSQAVSMLAGNSCQNSFRHCWRLLLTSTYRHSGLLQSQKRSCALPRLSSAY